ncbi:MAG: Fic family protein [Bacteroidota bacterium]
MSSFLDDLPEVFVSNTAISASVYQAVEQGKLRKIGSRLYTKNLRDDAEVIVKRNLYYLLKEYYPDALIADRTALENKPAGDGSVFLISKKKRKIELPGITFHPRKGHKPLESDRDFINGIKLSSIPRAYIENMRPSRARSGVARTLSRKEMEERLDAYLRLKGDNALNKLRDDALTVSKALDMDEEYNQLNELIGSLFGTKDAKLVSETGKARKVGIPYDSDRLDVFNALFTTLRETAPHIRSSSELSTAETTNLSFFEAYFSNFIEGTEFEVEEAADIVFNNEIPVERPQDAHDVLGTYRIVSNYDEMMITPQDFDHFLQLLKRRHAIFMELRPDKNPGEFKKKANVAGTTHFVAPDLVVGTLKKGFEIYQGLEEPFDKAVYMMFLVSEVHPFTEGNGRAARIMMNAELVAAQEQKIIIPTIYRSNYLSALKALTQNHVANPIVRTLDFAQKYTQSVSWLTYEESMQDLRKTNAFMDPTLADNQGIRLRLPTTA